VISNSVTIRVRSAPQMTCNVIGLKIKVHGAGSVADDFDLAYAWAKSRSLRLADGPDEVHRATIAKIELKKQSPRWIYTDGR